MSEYLTDKPTVAVVGAGGTISGVAADRSDPGKYQPGQLAIADMIAELQPHVGGIANTIAVTFERDPKTTWRISEYCVLTGLVEEQLRHVDGVVVTTGTDWIEETAYWLDLTVPSPKPVVVTAALRPWNALSSDGPLNLLNAVRVAASGKTAWAGTVVALKDEVHAARDVTKADARHVDAFNSKRKGALGRLDGPDITLDRMPPRYALRGDLESWATPFNLAGIAAESLPRVEIVYACTDAGGESITSFAATGVRGIVLAGAGAGRVSDAMVLACREVKQHVTFVSTSRTGSGAVGPAEDEIITGGDLSPCKARLLLLLALGFGHAPKTVRDWVMRYGNPEFPASATE